MEKFSVIIPTLWKSEITNDLLYDLITCDYIGEIILIDNANKYESMELKIKMLDEKTLLKLKIFPQTENIYVNPSWNLGIEESKYENICICNDDNIFDMVIFKKVSEIIDNNEISAIGPSKNNFKHKDVNHKKIKNPNLIKFEKSTRRESGWGCVMFFKKYKWIKIHYNIKIFCGDDLIYDFMKGKPYIIKNFEIYGGFSATVKNKEFRKITSTDIQLYKKYKINKQKKVH